ncbi:MAG: hypothetical protein JW384_02942 [Nitrosomonadaceae bacterium]|nr:hypothetical protein [Nitrosomonadaceae bacterium]
MRMGTVFNKAETLSIAKLSELVNIWLDYSPNMNGDHSRSILVNSAGDIIDIQTKGFWSGISENNPVSRVNNRKPCGDEGVSRDNNRFAANT